MQVVFAVLVVATLLALGLARAWRRRRAAPSSAPAAPEPADVDDELREIFLAEARGEIGALRRGLPRWRMQPDDLERAVPLRRSFHTLKGSGRLVGAAALGEFSAKLEQVLLRVIDGTLAPRPEVVDVVTRAVALLPGLVAEFAGERVAGANVEAVAQTAERLVAGSGNAVPRRAVGAR